MVAKDQHIKLIVKTLNHGVLDYWTVVFDRPPGFIFEAGDWIDIEFGESPLKGGKTYSISSSPTETDIQITFREGLSELKRALKDVRPGDELYISQYGNDYDFQLNRNRSSVHIAGGVGIAPFRSMLREMVDDHDTNDVSLIHSLIGDIGQNFYISGSPAMVEANEHLLIDMGVQIRNIRIDSFGGY